MSSLSKSSATQDTQTTSKTKPLDWQADELKNAFNKANTALGQAEGAPTPDNFTAQFTPDQLAVFQKMMGYGSSSAAGDAGGALSQAGVNAATGGLDAISDWAPKGGTQYNIDAATQYANNPAMDGAIDAAMRDARRQVSEEALPGVARNAALTGNVNASKTAISEGILQRGLAEKGADVSSAMRADAYDKGLNLAQNEANSSNVSQLAALSARVAGGTNAVNTGVGALTSQGDIYDIAGKGVAGQINAQQAGLDEQAAQYQFGTNSPFDALNNYYNIVGNKNWGSNTQGTSSTQTTATPSVMDTIGKAVGTAGAIAGKGGFNWLPSDARVKTNISVVGELYDGLAVYRFNYIGDPTTQIGLMAQDVEKVYPEAVKTINGVKHVNYDLATRHSAT